MLCQFSFQNFKCFKQEALLDFCAESIGKSDKRLIIDEADGEKFLPVIAIYGPNGGGKSTVLEALGFLRTCVVRNMLPSLSIDKNSKEDISKFMHRLLETGTGEKYHKFDNDCKSIPVSFDVLFRTVNKEYRFQLSLLHDVIVEENLYMRVIGETDAVIVFERSEEDCFLGDSLQGIAVEKVKSTMPLISHISINYDIELINDAVSWFFELSFLDYDNPRRENRILFPKAKSQQKNFFEMLYRMDINISGFRIEKDLDGNISKIYTKHTLEDGTSHELLFEEESSGTRKLFSCLADIMECLRKGKLIIADELDAKLHPKLLRFIIEMFTDPKSNKKGAQLLLTSHDITTMIPEVFRRDEIWFCALNPDNASKLYSLIAFRKENGKPPRNDEVYGKRYLEGHYGADPYIRRILDWGGG